MKLPAAVRDLRTIKELLTAAEEEARRQGDELPGPEHLLVSAAGMPDGTAARVLERFGADRAAVVAAVGQVHASALAGTGWDDAPDTGITTPAPAAGAYRSTPQAQEVFQEAVALSKASKPSHLLGAHVVAAVCSLERGTAARALATLGIDRAELRAAALAEARAAR